jgi:hypothetical protein
VNVRAILDELATSGPITASRIVAVAADPDHPLHPRFQWDDTLAAREFRLIQARQLIVSIRYIPEGGTKSIQALIHVSTPGGGEGEYVLASVIARQPERWARARDEVIKYLDAAQEGLDDLDEILRVFGPPRPQTGRAAKAIKDARSEVQAVSA